MKKTEEKDTQKNKEHQALIEKNIQNVYCMFNNQVIDAILKRPELFVDDKILSVGISFVDDEFVYTFSSPKAAALWWGFVDNLTENEIKNFVSTVKKSIKPEKVNPIKETKKRVAAKKSTTKV